MVGSLKNIDPAYLAEKMKKIEGYIQQVSQVSREKFNLDDELDRMVQDLQDEVERQRSKVSSSVIAEINQTRLELSKT